MTEYNSPLFNRQLDPYTREILPELALGALDKFDTDAFNAMWEKSQRQNNMTLKEYFEEKYKKDAEKYEKCIHTTIDKINHEYFLDIISICDNNTDNNTNNNKIDLSNCLKYNYCNNMPIYNDFDSAMEQLKKLTENKVFQDIKKILLIKRQPFTKCCQVKKEKDHWPIILATWTPETGIVIHREKTIDL